MEESSVSGNYRQAKIGGSYAAKLFKALPMQWPNNGVSKMSNDLIECDACNNVLDPHQHEHDLVDDKYGRSYWICGTCLHGHSDLELLELLDRE